MPLLGPTVWGRIRNINRTAPLIFNYIIVDIYRRVPAPKTRPHIIYMDPVQDRIVNQIIPSNFVTIYRIRGTIRNIIKMLKSIYACTISTGIANTIIRRASPCAIIRIK